jgi:EpsI family protein
MSAALLVRLLALVGFLAGFLWAETAAIRGMLRLFDTSPMYSYGYLVPFISLFLVWSRRRELAALSPQPSLALGGTVMAVWALLVVVGEVTGLNLLSQLALVVGVAGLVLLLLGTAYLRVTWAAVAYLLLMVPLWDAFTEPMHLRFQLLSAGLGMRLLEVLGIPAYREHTIIHLPTISLEVARACSGVNYLVAVLALGLPLSYLYLRSMWRRIVLVTSALLIAALSNSLRVATIGILVHLDVGAPLHGPAHVLHGLFVSGIGYVALFVGLRLLNDMPPAADATPSDAASAAPALARARVRLAALPLAPFVTAALLALAAATVLPLLRPRPVPLAVSLERLPARLGAWTADPYATPDSAHGWGTADHELRRRYLLGDQSVDVFVGYFEKQQQARELVTPKAVALRRLARDPGNGEGGFAVNVARETEGGANRVTVFWFELEGAVVTSPDAVRLRTLWSTLGRRRSNGAVVSLTAAGSAADASREPGLLSLAREIHLALRTLLPSGDVAPARVATTTDASGGRAR